MIPRRSTSSLLRRCETLLTRLSSARALSSAPTTTTTPIIHAVGSTSTPTHDFETDVLVIGAGVVGLAVARAAARRGASVVVVERRSAFGTETSSRSSEVIHAGLYYPPGSLKATLCARGRDMLYDYCAQKGVAHKKIGKLVVAAGADGGGEDRRLDALAANADAACARAGAAPLGLRLLTGRQARNLEPSLGSKVTRALLSPRTGIVDSHGLMAALLADAEAGTAGGGGATTLALRSAAVPMMMGRGLGTPPPNRMLTVAVRDVGGSGAAAEGDSDGGGATKAETAVFGARAVINCAGLGAESCARGALAHLGPGVASTAPRVRYAKGNYFELAGGVRGGGGTEGDDGSDNGNDSAPPFFSRLIYPLPEDGGLGIHLTLDLAGRARFGPDVEWLPTQESADAAAAAAQEPSFDFSVAPQRAAAAGWHSAIRAYWPGLPNSPEALVPGYSGIRPKLSGPGEPPEDFGVQTATEATWRGGKGHGVSGLVSLFGVESPGLTSALALAEHVVEAAGMR